MKKDGAMSEIGVAILGIGMITGMHAAISPSVFTFNCFAKKESEKAIGRRTLWISLGATSVTTLGLHIVFGRWVATIVSEITALGLFGLGMYAIGCAESAPETPSMAPPGTPKAVPSENQAELPELEMTAKAEPEEELYAGMFGLRRPEMHYGVIRGMGRIRQPAVLRVG